MANTKIKSKQGEIDLVYRYSYAKIKALKDAGKLHPMANYEIIDYRTKHVIPTTSRINEGELEPLIITAVSENKFDSVAKSELYPSDIILYDFDDNLCEDNTTPRTGWIYEREDTVNKTKVKGYDWRSVKFTRSKILRKMKETVSSISSNELDVLLTFSTDLPSSLTTIIMWSMEIPEEVTHGAGELNLTVRKGARTFTRQLRSYLNETEFTENQLSGTSAQVVYCPKRDCFIWNNQFSFGESIIGKYAGIGSNQFFNHAYGLRYEVDLDDYQDFLTFNGTVSNTEIGFTSSLPNNVFMGNVSMGKFSDYTYNNTFLGEILNLSTGGEFYNNIFASGIRWSEFHNEVFNNYFDGSGGILGGTVIQNLNIRDSFYGVTVFAPSYLTEFNGYNGGGFLFLKGNGYRFDGHIENTIMFLEAPAGGSGRSRFSFTGSTYSALIGHIDATGLIINKNIVGDSIHEKPDSEFNANSTRVQTINIDQLQTPVGSVQLVGRDEEGKTVDATHLLDVLAPPVEYIQPTINLTTNQISTGREVGEAIDAVLTTFHNKNDAGDVTKIEYLKNGSVIHTINNPSQSTTYTDEGIVLSTTPISYTARITYEQGPVKNNSLGNPSPSGRIEAGSLTSVQRNAFGTYVVCFGAVSSVPTNSAQARSMTTVVRGGADVRILDCGTVDTIQAILLPPGTNLVSVIDLDAAMQDLTIQYILEDSNFTVNDASGNPVSGYKLYVRTQGTPYPTNHRHQFTMS